MRTVIVTGAAAGIGRETAKLFAGKGDRVIIADIDEAGAGTVVEQISAAGGHAIARRLDVAVETQWNDFADWVRAEFGAAHVLINNAGVMDVGGFVEMDAKQWQRTIDIDLMSVIYGSRAFAQQMIDAEVRGHIVNISSMAAFFPSPLEPAYGVAKAAVLMATQSLRIELRRHGIGVSAICPGAIRTDLIAHGRRAGLTESDEAEWRREAAEMQAFALAAPEKVARVIERAVRHNWAVVPVNLESWAAYGLFRASPSLTRRILAETSFDRAEAAIARVKPLLTRLASR